MMLSRRTTARRIIALRAMVPLALLSMFAIPTPTAQAATQLQGFYEAFAQGTREDETWQFNMPNHYLELKALATPHSDFETFIKLSAQANRFRTVQSEPDPIDGGTGDDVNVHRADVFFNEGHVRWRRDHLEAVAFSGQNNFWFSQPLLNVVNGNTLQDYRDGPRSQALKLDFWELAGFGGLAYVGDMHTNRDDFFATRIHKSLAQNKLRFGTTYGRRNFEASGGSAYDQAFAVDAELAMGEISETLGRLGRTTLVMEVGRNISNDIGLDPHFANGAQVELRDVRYDAVTFKSSAWYREPQFYSGISGREGDNDRRGYSFEVWYRLPKKQVNLRWNHWRNRSFIDLGSNNERFFQKQHELEAYMEIKGGFSSWIKWRRFDTNPDPFAGGVFKNLIWELQAQNKLISVRSQVRFRDYGTRFATEGFGMDINLNVSSRWKIFGRFLNANENTESRRTFFVHARYDAWSNAEFFIDYGDGGRSDRLTENDGFVGEGPGARDQDNERRAQLIMKMWF
jgi:hypothetical protein